MFLPGNIAGVGYKSAIIFNAFSIGYSLDKNTIKKTIIGNYIWFSVCERRHAKVVFFLPKNYICVSQLFHP
jgi:hypothetical protein